MPQLPGRIKTAYVNEVRFVELVEYIVGDPILLAAFQVFKLEFV